VSPISKQQPAASTHEQQMTWWSPLSSAEVRVTVVALIASLIARWHAFAPAYSIDDYGLMTEGGSGLLSGAIAQGRSLVFLLRAALTSLGALPPHSFVLGSVIMHATLVGIAVFCCRLWGIQERFSIAAAASLLFVLHPYQAEIFTFKTAVLFVALALALAFLGLAAAASHGWRFGAGVLAFTAALMLYQAVLNYAAVAVLFGALIYFARGEAAWFFRNVARRQITLIAVSVVLYFAATAAIASAAAVGMNERTELLRAGDIGTRIGVAGQQLQQMFTRPEPIMPRLPKLLLAFATAAAAVGALAASRHRGRTAAAIGVAVLIGAPLCLGVVLVLKQWWPVPRVFAHTGLMWAGMFALCAGSSAPVFRRIALGVAAVVVFSFIGTNNHVFSDQLRIQMRDVSKTNRILGRIEMLPDFRSLQGIVVHGGYWTYALPLATQQGDMNVSLLYPAWTKRPLMNEVSGYNFPPAPDAVAGKAAAWCTPEKKWPAAEAVTAIDNFAVVCLAE
jgi:hypothetical protein